MPTTTVADSLRGGRLSLGISQSRLARLSGVSRYRICIYELGSGRLAPDEQNRIAQALQAEAERLRNIKVRVDFSRVGFTEEVM